MGLKVCTTAWLGISCLIFWLNEETPHPFSKILLQAYLYLYLFLIENKPKKELIKVLIQRGYDSDPVKAWKEAQQKVNPLLATG